MKKMFTLLLTLFVLYFGIQFAFNYFSKGHDVTYSIKTDNGDINVREILGVNGTEKNNYYFEISYNNKIIPFKVMKDYMRKQKIIRNINIFESSNYTCAKLEVERDTNPTDIKCINNSTNIAYNYSGMYGVDVALDNIIKDSDYNYSFYNNNTTETKDKDGITVYTKNLLEKNNVLINAYKGVYLFGQKVTSQARFVELFNSDVYDQSIQGIAGKYYIVADYGVEHQFSNFHVINIENGTKYDISTNLNISFNSFVEGSINNKLYLIDIENKKQYEVDAKNKKVNLISSGNTAKDYQNNELIDADLSSLISSKKKFNTVSNQVNGVTYDSVMLVGDTTNGTYYVSRSNGTSYDVYAIYTKSNTLNYLFTTTDPNRLFYNNGLMYYINDESLCVFGESYGNKSLITYKELKYNPNIHLYAY